MPDDLIHFHQIQTNDGPILQASNDRVSIRSEPLHMDAKNAQAAALLDAVGDLTGNHPRAHRIDELLRCIYEHLQVERQEARG